MSTGLARIRKFRTTLYDCWLKAGGGNRLTKIIGETDSAFLEATKLITRVLPRELSIEIDSKITTYVTATPRPQSLPEADVIDVKPNDSNDLDNIDNTNSSTTTEDDTASTQKLDIVDRLSTNQPEGKADK